MFDLIFHSAGETLDDVSLSDCALKCFKIKLTYSISYPVVPGDYNLKMVY